MNNFRALVLDQEGEKTTAQLQALTTESLPDGDVLVEVAYSSLNYKDGLAITGAGKVIRGTFPFVPGIDLAGTVRESMSPNFRPGDQVVATGWGIGERCWGGLGQFARLRSDWLIHLPEGLDLRTAMGIGTAGLTAMLCILALEEHGVTPAGREIVVTGASGGVGSVAIAVLANLGYKVVASTGRAENHSYLRELGATETIDRTSLGTPSPRPLDSERWGGAIDTVGGDTLVSVLKGTAYGGSVTSCGLAGGTTLNGNVFPFVLRGVNLLGIDSVYASLPRRVQAWKRLSRDLPLGLMNQVIQEISLQRVPEMCRALLAGQVRGRIVVDLKDS